MYFFFFLDILPIEVINELLFKKRRDKSEGDHLKTFSSGGGRLSFFVFQLPTVVTKFSSSEFLLNMGLRTISMDFSLNFVVEYLWL